MTNVPITKLTDKVSTLQRLEMLSLDSCSLSHMPNLSGMSRLYRVFAPHNRLSKLEGLMNVNHLWLDDNLFTEIPTQTEPEALVRLYMNYNPVKSMKLNTAVYSNLTEIKLSKTEISVIPNDIHDFPSLYFLDVSFSKLSSVPKSIVKVTKLHYLVIYDNPFSAEEIDSIKFEFSTKRPDVTLLI
jgi:Leucine-rich repeat (LRR) protein